MTNEQPLTDDERALIASIKRAHQALEAALREAKTVDLATHRCLTYALNLIEELLGVYGRRDMLERLAAARRTGGE